MLDEVELLDLARLTLQNCMLGKLDARTADTQRRAALDILDRGMLEHLTDDQLRAEGNRIADEMDRRKALRAAK